jgi:hypothetical protein
LVLILLSASVRGFGAALIVDDAKHKLVTVSDGQGRLALRLNYNAGCMGGVRPE